MYVHTFLVHSNYVRTRIYIHVAIDYIYVTYLAVTEHQLPAKHGNKSVYSNIVMYVYVYASVYVHSYVHK